MKYAIKNRFSGAVMFEAELDASYARESDGVRLGAAVKLAVKARADLARANLAIALGFPNGWPAFAWCREGVLMVQVGCRSKSIAEAREYWAGKDDRREVLAALDYAESVARLREWPIKEFAKAA